MEVFNTLHLPIYIFLYGTWINLLLIIIIRTCERRWNGDSPHFHSTIEPTEAQRNWAYLCETVTGRTTGQTSGWECLQ